MGMRVKYHILLILSESSAVPSSAGLHCFLGSKPLFSPKTGFAVPMPPLKPSAEKQTQKHIKSQKVGRIINIEKVFSRKTPPLPIVKVNGHKSQGGNTSPGNAVYHGRCHARCRPQSASPEPVKKHRHENAHGSVIGLKERGGRASGSCAENLQRRMAEISADSQDTYPCNS